MLTYKYLTEGYLMPAVSLFGLFGNGLSIHILRKRELKLKHDFVTILCSLAVFDSLLLVTTFFLFSLPALSDHYNANIFPYTVPYLFPITNTFMTCSIYMTAGIAVNRYLDIIDLDRRIKNGLLQAVIVLVLASLVNVPRWFEFEYHFKVVPVNGTVNRTQVFPRATQLRLDDNYVKYYTLITSSILIVIIPSLYMLVSTFLISRSMMKATMGTTTTGFLSDSQEQARRKRNRGITLMLIGIIILFIVCHVGEIFMSLYELLDLLDGKRSVFPTWAKNFITTNHLLLVINSSLNFIFYCRDIVFRRCFLMIYQKYRKKKKREDLVGCNGTLSNNNNPTTFHSAAFQLRSLNEEFGINLQGDPSPEVILRDLDPQSKILCGLSSS